MCNTCEIGHHLKHHDPETFFTCPMHPEVQSDRPGRCPECGMNLVKGGEKDET